MSTETKTSWPLPDLMTRFDSGPGRSSEDRETWRRLVVQVHAVAARHGWSKAETARRIDMSGGTFSDWFAGAQRGRFDTSNERVAKWLAAVEESEAVARTLPESPGFIHTRLANEIMNTLAIAQTLPALVVVTAAAGLGKTKAVEQYAAARPHVFVATMSPDTASRHAMLVELTKVLGIPQGHSMGLARRVGERLRSAGGKALLIFDEAQHMDNDAVNQARHFVDIYKCGVALVGNTATYGRFSTSALANGEMMAQICRRIFKRTRVELPYPEDLAALIDAWGIEGEKERQFVTGIGMKPGALGQIDMTVRLAKTLALGEGREVEIADLKRAWKNRDVEGMA